MSESFPWKGFDMFILGIDTSAVVCSVGLLSDDTCVASRTVCEGLTHSETLLPLIKEILTEGKVGLSDLDGIAVSHGPGSFTGLRIGISAVKGLSISKNIPCVGVSTLEALAVNAIESEGAVLCPVMDARRGEFYNALFRVENRKIIRLCEDRAISGAILSEELKLFDRVLVLGDGAEKFVQQNPLYASCLVPENCRFQSGESVARLGLEAIKDGKTCTCNELSPRYLRLPQAEREWRAKNK